jgi:hypothetical protein
LKPSWWNGCVDAFMNCNTAAASSSRAWTKVWCQWLEPLGGGSSSGGSGGSSEDLSEPPLPRPECVSTGVGVVVVGAGVSSEPDEPEPDDPEPELGLLPSAGVALPSPDPE